MISPADRTRGVAYLARLRREKPSTVTDRELLAADSRFMDGLRALRAAIKKAGDSAAVVDEMLVFRGTQHRCAVAVLAERENKPRPLTSAQAWGRK